MKKSSKENSYTIELVLGDQKLTAKGADVLEALEKLFSKEIPFKTKGKFLVSRGKSHREEFAYIVQLKRLAVNALTRKLWAKRMSIML